MSAALRVSFAAPVVTINLFTPSRQEMGIRLLHFDVLTFITSIIEVIR
jgi:hypothetical protein